MFMVLDTPCALQVNNIFTHLRKVAQHPLLVRSSFKDSMVAAMARIAASRWDRAQGTGHRVLH